MAVPKKETKQVEKPKRSWNVFALLYKVNLVLALVFLVVWIFIGGFFSFTILENLKLMAKQKVSDSLGTQMDQSTPTEFNLSGVGNVNVACVEKSVGSETVQKVITDKGPQNLSPEDKAKIEACIVPGAQATPSGSPTQ